MQGAAPISSSVLPSILISHSSMRKLGLSVNEVVFLHDANGLSPGDYTEGVDALDEPNLKQFFSSNSLLVGRAWPTAMVSGASLTIDDFSRSRLGLALGCPIALARISEISAKLLLARELYLSPIASHDIIHTCPGTTLLLAHQLSE